EDAWKLVDPGVHRRVSGVHVASRDFAENMEIRDALLAGAGLNRGHELLPELGIDVLRGVDAEAVDSISGDPTAIDVDHPADHPRMLGENVVEPEEVAHQARFTAERRIAA